MLYRIHSSAPTRICDNGGWTDTWFAEYGRVLNIAIEPRAHVEIQVFPRHKARPQITIHALNFGDHYGRELGTPWQKHPLIEATLEQIGVPEHVNLHITLHSDAPPGASLGTSAAITVALIGALDCLTDGRLSPYEIAQQAQQVETIQLGGQCGIQDQLSAAHGGINYIDMYQYPDAHVIPLQLSKRTLWELEQRLLVVYLGQPHNSSQVHEKVIAHLEHAGPTEARLEALRQTAIPARDALLNGDLTTFGQTLIANTEAQRKLHPDLISPLAQKVIDIALNHRASGWKVNGAGGSGGSVTILHDGGLHGRLQLQQAIQQLPHGQTITPKIAREGIVRYEIR